MNSIMKMFQITRMNDDFVIVGPMETIGNAAGPIPSASFPSEQAMGANLKARGFTEESVEKAIAKLNETGEVDLSF